MRELGLIVGLIIFTLAFGALVSYCVPMPDGLTEVRYPQ